MNKPETDAPVVRFRDLTLHYGKTLALDSVSLEIPKRLLIGLIGPDGVGKSSLLSLITGCHAMQEGDLWVLGGDMRDAAHRSRICPKVAYMPQGLGKNLYFTLTVEENLRFFGKLFGHNDAECSKRIERLTKSTGLYPFLNRPAGKLSGGMKQKLGLCCSLIHDPDLLVLDEPTTGVDPLARRQFWDLVDSIKEEQPDLSVMVATAYMDEAQRFDWLIAMDDGKILDTGAPGELLAKTHCSDLDSAFIQLLPESKRAGHKDLVVPPLPADAENDISIEAQGLTKKFGDFTAVDHVSFRIRHGEIFGFLGSNGCGKTTTMRMLTGLLPASEGQAYLFGEPIDGNSLEIRKKLGYMTQLFSLYNELTVRQNLELYARLYGIPEEKIESSVMEMMTRFGLLEFEDKQPNSLPLGIKQRLSLSAAVIHHPQILILDEPTSGVDPVARDGFWELIIELSRRDKVTIFITTHFMNEAARCDRISLMHRGKSLACDAPDVLQKERKAATLEEAFIGYLEDAGDGADAAAARAAKPVEEETADTGRQPGKFMQFLNSIFDFQRCFTCAWRELLELRRDPVRCTLALFGALILMFVVGYGLNMDVDDIRFAVLDNDQTQLSQDYCLELAGSRYFKECPEIASYDEIDSRLQSGELDVVMEIPANFAHDVQQKKEPTVAFWVNGDMCSRAESVNGYIQGLHALWLQRKMQPEIPKGYNLSPATIQQRYRYNPDVLSLPAMVPGVIPLLLMMIPAILSALAVVREKELGSIINLYVTPISRAEFLIGKQLPYLLFSMLSATLLVLMAVFIFDVPVKGSWTLLFVSLFIYCILSTGFGLIASSITKSQIAVIFLTMIATILPSTSLCGLINPVQMDSVSGLIGAIYPTTHMLLLSRGIFSKALGFADLYRPLIIMIIEVPVLMALGIMLQKKQES